MLFSRRIILRQVIIKEIFMTVKLKHIYFSLYFPLPFVKILQFLNKALLAKSIKHIVHTLFSATNWMEEKITIKKESKITPFIPHVVTRLTFWYSWPQKYPSIYILHVLYLISKVINRSSYDMKVRKESDLPQGFEKKYYCRRSLINLYPYIFPFGHNSLGGWYGLFSGIFRV